NPLHPSNGAGGFSREDVNGRPKLCRSRMIDVRVTRNPISHNPPYLRTSGDEMNSPVLPPRPRVSAVRFLRGLRVLRGERNLAVLRVGRPGAFTLLVRDAWIEAAGRFDVAHRLVV